MTTEAHRGFSTPEALAASPDLTRREKLEALRTWELDERLRMTATAENMAGGPANRLREIRRCLRALTDE